MLGRRADLASPSTDDQRSIDRRVAGLARGSPAIRPATPRFAGREARERRELVNISNR